jgi:hypothetical protein
VERAIQRNQKVNAADSSSYASKRQRNLGAWSYEIYDCKLARETKAATILQLSLYSDLVPAIHGLLPEQLYVVPPSEDLTPEPRRVLDFAVYYRYVKKRLENAVDLQAERAQTYPEPTPHCLVCRWWSECDLRRHNKVPGRRHAKLWCHACASFHPSGNSPSWQMHSELSKRMGSLSMECQ